MNSRPIRFCGCVTLILALCLVFAPGHALACTASTVSPSVTICSPTAGSSVASPVHVVALTTDNSHPVTAMKIYLDYTAVYSTSASSIDTYITVSTTGSHNLTINAWDSSGTVFKSAETFYVTSGSVTLAPTSLTFASQLVGTTSAAQNATLKNGTAAAITVSGVAVSGDFVITSKTCTSSLAAGASCTISVAFKPTATGTRTGTLTVSDSAGTQSTSLTGTGAAAVVSLSPASLTWGSQVVGTTSSAQNATLYNGTAAALSITSVAASGDFVLTSNGCGTTLAAGASCTIGVAFKPSTTGTRTGALAVTGSAGTQTTSLTGTGVTNSSSCQAGATNPSVTICLPTSSSTNPTPVHLTASTTSSSAITALNVLVDSSKVYTTTNPWIDLYVGMSGGAHTITVQATNSAGQAFQSSVSFTAQAPAQNWPPCALSTTNQTVTICNPPANAIVSTPVHLSAGTTDTSAVTQMRVAIDGATPSYTVVNAGTVDVYLTNLAAGAHTLAVTATDSAGVTYGSSVPVTVGDRSGLSNLQHIIFFAQENHSFDNYFGLLGPYRVAKGFSNVDGLNLSTTLYNSAGQAIKPYHLATVCTEDLAKNWTPGHLDVNNGKMNLFLKETAAYAASSIDPYGNRAIGYYDSADIPYYYELATQFPTSDRWFAPLVGPTVPNRMYMFAGTSFGNIYSVTAPSGGWTQPTIFDRLDAAGITWRYYLQDSTNFLNQWSTYTRDASKVFSIAQYYADVANNALPQVAFIERSAGGDEHPVNNIQKGAASMAKIINALLQSPSWASSAMILTYDEAGGWYDHVIPPPIMKPDNIAPKLQSGDAPGDFGRTGLRVPVMVMSPWARPHFVSHVWRDHTSILRLIEDRFGLKPLTARDATADNMMDMFDFSAPAFATPPSLPVQPTTGTCSTSLEQ